MNPYKIGTHEWHLFNLEVIVAGYPTMVITDVEDTDFGIMCHGVKLLPWDFWTYTGAGVHPVSEEAQENSVPRPFWSPWWLFKAIRRQYSHEPHEYVETMLDYYHEL